MIDYKCKLLAPTLNQAYTGKERRRLSPRAKSFKREFEFIFRMNFHKEYDIVKIRKELKGRKLILAIGLARCNWFTKSGSIRIVDASNYIKLNEDSFMKCLGVDDCQIWDIRAQKIEVENCYDQYTSFKLSIKED